MADAKSLQLGWMGFPSSAATYDNFALDASGDKYGAICQAISAEPITHLGFRYGVGTGTPPTYRVCLQGLTASGLPDGTILGGGSPASGSFTPPADTTWDGTWQWVALDNAYTPTRGEMFAFVVEHVSGTVDGSNHGTFSRGQNNAAKAGDGFPKPVFNATGSWTSGTPRIPCFGLRTASSRYGLISQGHYSTATAGTAGHRSAMHFTLPADWGDTFQLLGASVFGRCPVATSQFKFAVWSASGDELQSVTLDTDAMTTNNNSKAFDFVFTSLATLSYGTKYYIGFEVIGTATVGLHGIQLASADDRLAYPLGTNMGLATYDGSSWTEDNTVVPQCGLIFADITEPSGGGSGSVIVPAHGYTGMGVF